MRKRALLSVLVLLVGVVGCKKTVEGETKNWDRNLQQVKELSALYPGFAEALKQQQARAEKAMEAARTAPEEEKAKKMASANSLLSSGWVGNLKSVDGDIKDLRSKVTKATTGATDETGRLAAKTAADSANQIIQGVEAALKKGASDPDGAAAVVKKAMGDLDAAEKNIDQVLAAQKKAAQPTPTKTAGDKPATTPDTATAEKPAADQQWKCAYCGSANAHDRTSCKQCGAPKS